MVIGMSEREVELTKELSRYQNEVVDVLEERIKGLQKVVGIKDAALDNLRLERNRLRRTIELKEERIETLAEDVRAARQDRDKLREELGNLLSAIDQWKINSGLY